MPISSLIGKSYSMSGRIHGARGALPTAHSRCPGWSFEYEKCVTRAGKVFRFLLIHLLTFLFPETLSVYQAHPEPVSGCRSKSAIVAVIL